jgi:ADP-ribosylglycohydrolase
MDGMGDSARDRATRGRPNSWFRVLDPFFDGAGDVPDHGVVGWCRVGERGELTGEFRPNEAYLPSPVALGMPEPSGHLEHLLQCAATGHVPIASLARALLDDRILVRASADGGEISVFEDEPGHHHVVAYTSQERVPDSAGSLVVEGDVLAVMSAKVAIRVDPGTLASVTIPAGAVAPRDERATGEREPPESTEPAAESPGAHERFLGCVLAGALGDALGYGVRSQPIGSIRVQHGEAGLTAPIARDGLVRVSDATRLMLFTMDGLIRAHIARRIEPTGRGPEPEVQHAYQRWLHTQGRPWAEAGGPYARHLDQPDGWLIAHRDLFAPRGPESVCVSALDGFARTHRQGTFTDRVNDANGCGGLVRAAPVAVWSTDPGEVFHAAAATAALTHGHPSGHLPAGALAVLVHQLLRGASTEDAIGVVREFLPSYSGHEALMRALGSAESLALRGPVPPEVLAKQLGGGRTGDQALAIGLYSVLATRGLPEALLLAVNHSGDSDSTGTVCGNIAGALYGTRALSTNWLGGLELHDVVRRLAHDALAEFSPGPPADATWTQRYPAW